MRLKEHVAKSSSNNSAVGEHCNLTSHEIDPENVRILSREDKFWTRKIREAVEIRCHKPNLNRDCGYELPPVYLNLLRPSDHQRAYLRFHRGRALQSSQPVNITSTEEGPEMGPKALES